MKLALYNNFRLGIMNQNEDGIIDAMEILSEKASLVEHDPMQTVIDNWNEFKPKLQKLSTSKNSIPLKDIRLRAPLPRPGQIVCMAGNYFEPDHPVMMAFNGFIKTNTSVIGLNDTVILTPQTTKVFHFEPELGVIIGKHASNVTEEEALDYVFGYTNFIDASARGLGDGFFLQKSWATSGPMGPVIVTSEELGNQQDLNIRMWINNELRHDFTTKNMARSVPKLIHLISRAFPLEAGDIISTGTHHFGLKAIKNKDIVKMEIDKIGILQVNVNDPLNRTWPED